MKKKCIVCKRSKAGNYYDAFDHEDFAREIRAAVEETLSSYHRVS